MTSSSAAPADSPGPPHDVVDLTLPATTGYVGLARTVAAGMAARLDLDLDQVEDVRLAVSEACAVALPQATPGSRLSVRVHVEDTALVVEVGVATAAGVPLATDSFAWTVLQALADTATSQVNDGRLVIRLSFGRAGTAEQVAGAEPV